MTFLELMRYLPKPTLPVLQHTQPLIYPTITTNTKLAYIPVHR